MVSNTKRKDVKKINEAKNLYDLRLRKYTLGYKEINILKEIFDDINIENKNTNNDQSTVLPLTLDINTDFTADPETAYKKLAERFRKKIDGITAYNNDLDKLPWYKRIFFRFKKDTRALEGALMLINQHTYGRITLDNVATNYTNDENREHHKKFVFPNRATYTFSATNLLVTLEEKSKHFFGWSFGALAQLKNEFATKVIDVKEEIHKLAMKTNKLEIQQAMETTDVKILPFYTSPDVNPEGAINHFKLREAFFKTTQHLNDITLITYVARLNPAYFSHIQRAFDELERFERSSNNSVVSLPVLENCSKIFDNSIRLDENEKINTADKRTKVSQKASHIFRSDSIITLLKKIIKISSDEIARLNGAMPREGEVDSQQYRDFLTKHTENLSNIKDAAIADSKAVKAYAPYSKLMDFYKDPKRLSEEVQKIYAPNIIATSVESIPAPSHPLQPPGR